MPKAPCLPPPPTKATVSSMLEDKVPEDCLQGMTERFRGLRVSRGLKLDDVVEQTKLGIATIQRLEGTATKEGSFGPYGPGMRAVVRLAQFYGVSLDWLLGLAEDTNVLPAKYRLVDMDLVREIRRSDSRTELETRCRKEIIKAPGLLYDLEIPENRKVYHPDEPRYLELEVEVEGKLEDLGWPSVKKRNRAEDKHAREGDSGPPPT